MNYKTLIIAAFIALAGPAMAEFETVSRAYEIDLEWVSVPPTQNSRISFSQCEDCEATTARLTPNTQYSINGEKVRFDRFRKAILSAKAAENAGMILKHHLESDTVVYVSINL